MLRCAVQRLAYCKHPLLCSPTSSRELLVPHTYDKPRDSSFGRIRLSTLARLDHDWTTQGRTAGVDSSSRPDAVFVHLRALMPAYPHACNPTSRILICWLHPSLRWTSLQPSNIRARTPDITSAFPDFGFGLQSGQAGKEGRHVSRIVPVQCIELSRVGVRVGKHASVCVYVCTSNQASPVQLSLVRPRVSWFNLADDHLPRVRRSSLVDAGDGVEEALES